MDSPKGERLLPLTLQEAFDATDPALPEEQRKESAARIMAGTAANEAYWNSRGELEQVKAFATGHGVVARGPDEEGGDPTHVGTGTGLSGALTTSGTPPPNETAPAVGASESAGGTDAGSGAPSDADTIAKLRAQIEASGGTPEA